MENKLHIFNYLKGESFMETNEIIKNEEVIETEKNEWVSLGRCMIIADIGLMTLALGIVVGKFVIKPMAAKIKSKMERKSKVKSENENEIVVVESEESNEEKPKQ